MSLDVTAAVRIELPVELIFPADEAAKAYFLRQPGQTLRLRYGRPRVSRMLSQFNTRSPSPTPMSKMPPTISIGRW